MYNNEVTYAKCWDNKRARKFQKKLRKFLKRTDCMSDCPLAWSEEMYNFIVDIDKRFGIARTTNTFHGFYFQGSDFGNIFVEPLKRLFGKYQPPKQEWALKYEPKTKLGFLIKRIKNAKHVFSYGVRTCFYKYYRRLMDYIFKPQVHISQIKEKYGTLRVYFNANDSAIDKYIEQKINEMEFRIAQKGAYFPLADMMGWFSTSYTDHGHEVKPNSSGGYGITKYKYRIIARDLLPKEEYEKLMLEYKQKEAQDAAADSVDSSVGLNKNRTETK